MVLAQRSRPTRLLRRSTRRRRRSALGWANDLCRPKPRIFVAGCCHDRAGARLSGGCLFVCCCDGSAKALGGRAPAPQVRPGSWIEEVAAMFSRWDERV